MFFNSDHTIFDKLFGLAPVIQTVIPADKILFCRLGYCDGV